MAIGIGPILPFQFDGAGSTPQLANDVALINSALEMLFKTEAGERPIEKDFGSSLPKLLFLNFDETVAQLASQFVVETIQQWEDRIVIDLVEIGFDRQQPDRFTIRIFYTILETGVEGSTNITIGGTGEP